MERTGWYSVFENYIEDIVVICKHQSSTCKLILIQTYGKCTGFFLHWWVWFNLKQPLALIHVWICACGSSWIIGNASKYINMNTQIWDQYIKQDWGIIIIIIHECIFHVFTGSSSEYCNHHQMHSMTSSGLQPLVQLMTDD